jgi:hypothetical protein
VLVVGAYRSDELYPALPMRELRARLLGQRLAEEIRLPRLGLVQTASLVSAVLGRPAPGRVVAAVHSAATASRCTSRSFSRLSMTMP